VKYQEEKTKILEKKTL